jgi:hypothetical protein
MASARMDSTSSKKMQKDNFMHEFEDEDSNKDIDDEKTADKME